MRIPKNFSVFDRGWGCHQAAGHRKEIVMDPDLKETINTKLAEALDGDFNEQEFLALKRKVEAIAELSKLLGE